jgi:predicted esterase
MEQLSPVRTIAVRYFALLLLSAATVLAQTPRAAAQGGNPFGVPCDGTDISGTPYLTGVNCRLMAIDGYVRSYIVWVPPGLGPGAPVVFMLHGGSGNGGQFLSSSGWREKATQEGFVAVFPTAVEHFVLETQRFSTRWNNYELPMEIDLNRRPAGYPARAPWPADDVGFIRQIGGDLIQQLSADPHQLFVAGFSSGGGMCARLGVEASDLIAAVACHSSGLHQVHETRAGSRNLSAFFTLGTRDGNALGVINEYLIALGEAPITELPLAASALQRIPQMASMIAVNLDSFNLRSAPLTTTEELNFTRIHGQAAQPGNGDGNELFFTFLDDVPHRYPATIPDLAWPFFQQHPRP